MAEAHDDELRCAELVWDEEGDGFDERRPRADASDHQVEPLRCDTSSVGSATAASGQALVPRDEQAVAESDATSSLAADDSKSSQPANQQLPLLSSDVDMWLRKVLAFPWFSAQPYRRSERHLLLVAGTRPSRCDPCRSATEWA